MDDSKAGKKVVDDRHTEFQTVLESGVEKIVLDENNAKNEAIPENKAKNETIEESKAESESVDKNEAENECKELKKTINESKAIDESEESCVEKNVSDESNAKNEAIPENKAKNETIDESKAESESIEKNEAVNECKDRKKTLAEKKAESNSSDGSRVENICFPFPRIFFSGTSMSNARGDTENNGRIPGDCTGILSEQAAFKESFRKCCIFAENSYRYLKQTYDTSKHGTSDIKDKYFKLPVICTPSYAESIHRYNSTEALEMYSEIALSENRSYKLMLAFEERLINIGNNKKVWEFLLHVAFAYFAAFDLKEEKGFEEAPDCVIRAVAHAISATDQVYWLDEWSVPDDDDELCGNSE